MNGYKVLTAGQFRSLSGNMFSTAVILGVALVTRVLLVRAFVMALRKVKHASPKSVKAFEARARTLSSLVRSVFDVTVMVVALMIILSEWGVNITPFLTGAGVLV